MLLQVAVHEKTNSTNLVWYIPC